MRPPASTRTRAEELATRLAALAEEVGTLPMVEATDEKEPRSASAAAFARTLLRERRMREAEFPPELLGEPVWDILLDLFAAQEEGKCVSISSACIASGAPPTTGLRYIAAMERLKLLTREACPTDKRTTYLKLSCTARLKMAALLARMRIARGLPPVEPAEPDQGAQLGD
jgi:DNA-binding MarR family transcriptional regulator